MNVRAGPGRSLWSWTEDHMEKVDLHDCHVARWGSCPRLVIPSASGALDKTGAPGEGG